MEIKLSIFLQEFEKRDPEWEFGLIRGFMPGGNLDKHVLVIYKVKLCY